MDIKRVSEISAAIVPPLILCSCIRLVTYYAHWKIPILDYLTSSELLFSFIQPGLVFIALAAIYAGVMLLFTGAMLLIAQSGLMKKDEKKPSAEAAKAAEEPKAEKGKYAMLARIFVVVWLGFIVWVFFQGIWYDFELVPTVLLHVLVWITAIGVTRKLLSEPAGTNPSSNSVLVGTILTLISASFFYGRYQIHDTSMHPVPHTIKLADNTEIVTDKMLIYLGKSTDYFFLYDGAKNLAKIIPAREVKAIGIGK